MSVGDISRRKGTDKEADKEIPKNSGQAYASADRPRERGGKQHHTDLENRGSLRHIPQATGSARQAATQRSREASETARNSSTSVCAQPARTAHARWAGGPA